MNLNVLAAVALLFSPLPPFEAPPWAEATLPAVRLDPPAPPVTDAPLPSGSPDSADGRCVGWEPVLTFYSPGWDVGRMSRIMYRESRCKPGVRNHSGATGLLQIMPVHCSWLPSPCNLTNPYFNIAAAAELWQRQGYGAWAT